MGGGGGGGWEQCSMEGKPFSRRGGGGAFVGEGNVQVSPLSV